MEDNQDTPMLCDLTTVTGIVCEDFEVCENIAEFEPNKPKVCGRCNQEVETLFDSGSCDHEFCVDCRFKDFVQCSFCPLTKHEEARSIGKTDISEPVLENFVNKKLINKDHIIDLQQKGGTSVSKQMCTVCQRVFLKTNARYHYACASGVKPFQCTECDQGFVKKSHLQSHLNGHFGIKPFKCMVEGCNASFTQKDKLVRHRKTHISEKHMCSVCDKTYSSLAILRFHMEKVHSTTKLFKCDMCPRTYKYQRTLTVHHLKHQESKDHLCEICGKKYAVAAQLKQHKRSHVPISQRPYKCRRPCKQRFITLHDKARHELIHNHSSFRDFECSLCNITFGRKDNLERHMKNLHQVPWNLGKSVKLSTVVLPCNMKTPRLENKIPITLNKTIKSGKIKHKNITGISTTEIKPDTICKKSVNDKNKTLDNRKMKENETIERLENVNYKEKLNQPQINERESVIVKSYSIKVVPELQAPLDPPLYEKHQSVVCNNDINRSLPSSIIFPVNVSASNNKNTIVDTVNYDEISLEDSSPSRIIRHTDSLKKDYSSNKNSHTDKIMRQGYNIPSIIFRNYQS